MAKLRLTNAMREGLLKHAEELLEALPEHKDLDDQINSNLAEYRKMMRLHIEEFVPQKEMKILEKWNCVYVVKEADYRTEPWKDDRERSDWRMKFYCSDGKKNIRVLRGDRKGELEYCEERVPILTDKGLWIPTAELARESVLAIKPDHVLYGLAQEISRLYTARWYYRKERLADYRKLVNSCRYFEEVCEVWQEAQALRPKFGGNAGGTLVVLNSDVIIRIQQDQKKREQAA